jgi:hypothetical protein
VALIGVVINELILEACLVDNDLLVGHKTNKGRKLLLDDVS